MTIKQIMPFPPTGEGGERDFWPLKMPRYPYGEARPGNDDEWIVGLALVEEEGITGVEYIVIKPDTRRIRVTGSLEGYGHYCYY